jgi:hypothetical protein
VKANRQDMMSAHYKPASIAHRLGYTDPKTMACYARFVDMAKANLALAIPVKLK